MKLCWSVATMTMWLCACEAEVLYRVPTPSPRPDPIPAPPNPIPAPPAPIPTQPVDHAPDPADVDLCDPTWTELTSFERPDVSDTGGYEGLSAGHAGDGFAVESETIDVMGVELWEIACGRQAIDLSGWNASTIRLDVATVPGATYRLRYVYATNPDYAYGPVGPKTLSVLWDGEEVDVRHPDPAGRSFRVMRWELGSVDVVATGEHTSVRFASGDLSNSGPALDRITLDRLPN